MVPLAPFAIPSLVLPPVVLVCENVDVPLMFSVISEFADSPNCTFDTTVKVEESFKVTTPFGAVLVLPALKPPLISLAATDDVLFRVRFEETAPAPLPRPMLNHDTPVMAPVLLRLSCVFVPATSKPPTTNSVELNA